MARHLGFSFANTGACAQAQVHHSLLIWREKYRKYGQVSKTAEHARDVPAINVTKWRTTNKVLPRSFASRQSARGELLVKNMGSVKRTTLLVCLGVSSEKSVVIIHMIMPFILLLLVKMFATTRKRSGLSFSCLLRSAVAG